MSNQPVLLLDIRKADSIMESLIFGPDMLKNWPIINSCRLVFHNIYIYPILFILTNIIYVLKENF